MCVGSSSYSDWSSSPAVNDSIKNNNKNHRLSDIFFLFIKYKIISYQTFLVFVQSESLSAAVGGDKILETRPLLKFEATVSMLTEHSCL